MQFATALSISHAVPPAPTGSAVIVFCVYGPMEMHLSDVDAPYVVAIFPA